MCAFMLWGVMACSFAMPGFWYICCSTSGQSRQPASGAFSGPLYRNTVEGPEQLAEVVLLNPGGTAHVQRFPSHRAGVHLPNRFCSRRLGALRICFAASAGAARIDGGEFGC